MTETLTGRPALRAKQDTLWRAGHHPVGYALDLAIPLHIDARRTPEQASADDRVTCGTCTHLVRLSNAAGRARKCSIGTGEWMTPGPGTDLRREWPGCFRWTPRQEPT